MKRGAAPPCCAEFHDLEPAATSHVEVPVLVRPGLPALGRRRFPYVEGAPAFAWRIDCGTAFDGAAGSNSLSCDDLNGDNLEETLKDYEQGLVIGAGVDIPVMSIGALNLDARCTRGLSRITEDNIHNAAFSVMLGYAFGVPRGYGGTGPLGMPGGR